MSDVFLFMQQSWKNIWKQKTIWLFGALPLINQLFSLVQIRSDSNLFWLFLNRAGVFVDLAIYLISGVGVPYLAYCFSIGKSVTIVETLSAIKKFAGRVVGCGCLAFLILSPVIYWVIASSINNSTQPRQTPDQVILALLPLSLFSALWDFTLFGFFANDWGIRQSLKEAWRLFINHFGVLAMLGIFLSIAFKIYTTAIGALIVLVPSGFDMVVLDKMHYINPAAVLNKDLSFTLMNGVGQIVFTLLSSSTFALAFLKYSEIKSRVGLLTTSSQ